MTRAVWKYPIPTSGERVLEAPSLSIPRFFGFQGTTPTVWVEVDTELRTQEVWRIAIVGTGHPVPTGVGWSYIGSAIVAGGDFVFHAYARLEPTA